MLFAVADTPFYHPINSARGSQFFHKLTGTCYFYLILIAAIVIDAREHAIVVLTCVSLLIINV